MKQATCALLPCLVVVQPAHAGKISCFVWHENQAWRAGPVTVAQPASIVGDVPAHFSGSDGESGAAWPVSPSPFAGTYTHGGKR